MIDLSADSLGHPLEFPPEFKQWLADYVAQSVPKLPISQVFGFQLQRVRTATVDTAQSTTSTSYVDLATTGPTLSGLANGWYLLVFGADGTANSYVSVSVNSATAVDDDAVYFASTLFGASTALRILMVHLNTAGGNNEIKLKYRSASGSKTFSFRFLHAIKVLTLDE